MVHVSEAGDSALLLELEPIVDEAVNARAIAIADAVRGEAIHGVRDVVSTFRSVAVYFDPLVVDVDSIRAALTRASSLSGQVSSGRAIEIPVTYGGEAGPDLESVAALAGLTPQQVIAHHTGHAYRVFMLGFLPGFAYLGIVPPEIAAPRHSTPRVRVRGGSVGIAGQQTAVYPRDSPGGWQIIGHTGLRMFDAQQSPAHLLGPGDLVRFVPATAADSSSLAHTTSTRQTVDAPRGTAQPQAGEPHATGSSSAATAGRRTVTVLRPGLFTTVQDNGRWGHQSSGVSVSGAMDLSAHRSANALVGNERDAATLEATLAGPEVRLDAAATVAVSGADLGVTLDGSPLALDMPVRCRSGSVLRFGDRREGARAYIAFDGGVGVPNVLGSRSTHALSGLGGLDGRSLRSGDRLSLGPTRSSPRTHRAAPPEHGSAGGVRVRVLRGPQGEFFSDDSYATLIQRRFTVSPQSNRMGYRLQGPRIPRTADREMISDATFTGAIQVPASGEPILLMSDRQTAGGYPQIAVVISADLPRAAQLAPGDWIEFQLCSRADAIAALVAQEGKLLALG